MSTNVKVLPGAIVKVYRNELVVAQGFTDVNGHIEFYLEEDLYKVCAEKSGYLSDCVTTYLGSDKNLLLLLRKIVEHRITGTVEYGVSGSFIDEGSLVCVKLRYDPGDSRWYPPDGYDYIEDFIDENEFFSNWNLVEYANVMPQVVDCLLKGYALSSAPSFHYVIEKTFDDIIRRLVISLNLTTEYDNGMEIVVRKEKNVEYPYDKYILYYHKGGSRVCLWLFHFMDEYTVVQRSNCIGKDVSWHGESLLLIDVVDKIMRLYHETDMFVDNNISDVQLVDDAKYVMLRVYGGAIYGNTQPGNYYKPYIDYIGVKYV